MPKERWIAHNQDGMPKRLKPDTLVEVVFEDFSKLGLEQASWWNWHKNCGYDIIAYQIVK